ncbi:MAG: DUF255 domain-containing protein [Actinobacteria bacterium]|nr:DUF255 domain-containing protein [Actinomycetota bacterium]
MDGDTDFRFSPRPNRAHDIKWRPWGEPAFAEARELERPILLSLSAVWCHWCHVMDETSYSDPRVIAAINEHFVPIRVDNDRHPDVNRRYNMGGWPTTAFLAASGDPLTGATYMPPDQLLQALERVREFFAANRTALLTLGSADHAQYADREAALAHLGGAPRRGDRSAPDFDGDRDVPGDIPAEIALQIVRAFDPLHGGLGADPKFPQPDVFAFVLAFAELRGDRDPLHVAPHTSALVTPRRVREVVRTTLEGMAAGGLYDHIAGGFFRYATRRDWNVPHYEKMLEDNARLASLYLEAAVLARADGPGGDGATHAGFGPVALYGGAAAGTIDYLLATLWRADPPAFGGSQDADEHYYRLDASGRAELPAPFVDRTVYVDWNALAARALLRAAFVLRRPELTERALELLGFLREHGRHDVSMAHYLTPAGEPGAGAPLLVDQATMAAALLDAYEVTAERQWLEGAQALADWAGRHLRAADGRLHDRLAEPGVSAGLLARPLPVLEENALMAEVLLRLEAYTGESTWRDRAREILTAWAMHYGELGVAAALYGQALLRYLERPDHIVVVGHRGDAAAERLHDAALAAPRPLRTVQFLDQDDPADAERMAASGFERAAAPVAFVCRGSSCLAPITDPGELGRPLS